MLHFAVERTKNSCLDLSLGTEIIDSFDSIVRGKVRNNTSGLIYTIYTNPYIPYIPYIPYHIRAHAEMKSIHTVFARTQK
jgi:hypothetical protein